VPGLPAPARDRDRDGGRPHREVEPQQGREHFILL
jgi:hypothetical protein